MITHFLILLYIMMLLDAPFSVGQTSKFYSALKEVKIQIPNGTSCQVPLAMPIPLTWEIQCLEYKYLHFKSR